VHAVIIILYQPLKRIQQSWCVTLVSISPNIEIQTDAINNKSAGERVRLDTRK